jgi:hypothetical protein
MSTKVCKRCNTELNISEFYNHKMMKDGLMSWCKSCVSEASKKSKAKYPEKYESYDRNYMRNYNSKHPYVYRIKIKETGEYYLGNSKVHFNRRIGNHFGPTELNTSYFRGMDRDLCDIEVLCYCSSKKQAREIERALLETRVGVDPLCLNKNIGGK